MQDISISTINAFCRKFDLVFMETGREDKKDVLRFIDFNNSRCTFTPDEITAKLDIRQITSKIATA